MNRSVRGRPICRRDESLAAPLPRPLARRAAAAGHGRAVERRRHRATRSRTDSLFKHLAIFSEVLGLVRNNYVDPTDISTLLAGAMDGSTDALDAFSIYLPAGGVER